MQEAKKTWRESVKEFFLGPEPAETYSEPLPPTTPTGITPPPRPTGQVLDARTALGINPVYRAVDILKTSVSQLPLNVERGGSVIDSPSIISKPDVRSTQTQFLALTVHSLACYGNAYWRLHRAVEAPFEAVASIEVLNPELVVIDYDKGKRIYRYGSLTFADWQIQHLMIFPQFESHTGVVKGCGPIQANRAELQAALDLNAYIRDFYRNNGVPTGILTTDSALAAGDGDAIRERWYEIDSQNLIQVLPNGLTFQQISLDPEKAQFHASAQKLVVDVARMFGIPDRYLLAAVDGTSMTYQNMTEIDRQLIRYTLMQYVTAIEDAFSELLPRGQKAKFNLDAFLRGSTKERYEAHKLAIDAGFMSVNEVRALEGLPPINEGSATGTN